MNVMDEGTPAANAKLVRELARRVKQGPPLDLPGNPAAGRSPGAVIDWFFMTWRWDGAAWTRVDR